MTTAAEKEADRTRAVVETVSALQDDGRPPDELELSTGVVLKIRAVPKHFIYQVTARLERPEVPKVWIDQKDRFEENEADPKYAEALEMWAVEVASAGTDVALLRGTEIISIPEDVSGPDDELWVQEMELLDMPMIDNPRARYLAWVKAIAAPRDEDINSLLEAIGRLTGVSEEDVAEAVERFRSITARNSD